MPLRLYYVIRLHQEKSIQVFKMSAGTVQSSSSCGDTDTQTGTELMDESVYVYLMPEQERINVCYYLKDVWEDVAKKMGYTRNDLIVSFEFRHFQKGVFNSHTINGDWHQTNSSLLNLSFNLLFSPIFPVENQIYGRRQTNWASRTIIITVG